MQVPTDIQQQPLEELDYRESDGLEVSLLWNRADNRVSVSVVDMKAGVSFELAVVGADALHAFRHPFAYAARVGVASEPLAQAPSLA